MKTAFKIVLWTLILVTVGLVGYSCYTGFKVDPDVPATDVAFKQALDITFYWGYALFGVAILSAVVAFLINIISKPAGLGKTALGLGVVLAVVGTSVGLVWNKAVLAVPNSAGGLFSDPFELRISEISIYLTYIVAAIALLVIVFDVVSGLVRRFVK
jgi:hypothetical protein